MNIELELQSTTRNQDEFGAEWFQSTYKTKIGDALDISYEVSVSTDKDIAPYLLVSIDPITHNITTREVKVEIPPMTLGEVIELLTSNGTSSIERRILCDKIKDIYPNLFE